MVVQSNRKGNETINPTETLDVTAAIMKHFYSQEEGFIKIVPTRNQSGYFDVLAGMETPKIVLYGAGILGRHVTSGLVQAGVPPLAICDASREKWGQSVDGLRVSQPSEAISRYGQTACFVICVFSSGPIFREIRESLMDQGCSHVLHYLPLLWKYADQMLPYFSYDLPSRILTFRGKLEETFALLADAESQKVFEGLLRYLTQGTLEVFGDNSSDGQYFPKDLLAAKPQEVFVDCGAWDGDTLRAFLERYTDGFDSYMAFEPDPVNYRNLSQFVSTLPRKVSSRIAVISAALSNQPGMVRFQTGQGPMGAISSAGDLEVRAVTIDEYFHEAVRPAHKSTFVKMDIEGTELLALEGARKMIIEHQPVIAICIYHHPDHLWQIPLWIHSLKLNYRFFVRSHGCGGLETVLYAIPASRL